MLSPISTHTPVVERAMKYSTYKDLFQKCDDINVNGNYIIDCCESEFDAMLVVEYVSRYI